MKKHFLLGLFMTIFSVFMYAADINTPLFASYEFGGTSCLMPSAAGEIKDAVVVDNPSLVINTSLKCVYIPGGGDWYHKVHLEAAAGDCAVPASATHKYLHFFFYRPGGASEGVEIGIYNATNQIYQKTQLYSATTGWHDVVIDLSQAGAGYSGLSSANIKISKIWINIGTSPAYVDEFELSDSPTPRVYPAFDPTKIDTPLFATFEDGNPAPFVLNASDPAGNSNLGGQVVVNNPLRVTNTSEKCISIPSSGAWWEKAYFKIQGADKIVPKTAAHKYLHFFIYYPNSAAGAEMAIYTAAGTYVHQSSLAFTNTNAWQDVVIDITQPLEHDGNPYYAPGFNMSTDNIGAIWIRPFSNPFYVDEFELSSDPTPRVYPDPVLPKVIKEPLFATFEDADPVYVLPVEAGLAPGTITANPITTGLNTTDKCLKIEGNHEWWKKSGLMVTPGDRIEAASNSHKYLHFYAMSPSGNSSIEIQVFDIDGAHIYQNSIPVSGGEWVDMVYDLSYQMEHETFPGGILSGFNPATANIGKILILPPDPLYIDEFLLSDDATPRVAPEPTENPLFATFEDGVDSYMLPSDDGEIKGATIGANPDKTINTTDKCVLVSQPGDWWHKVHMNAVPDHYIIPASAAHKYLHFFIYQPAGAAGEVEIGVVDDNGTDIFQKTINTVTPGGWYDAVFDLTGTDNGKPGITPTSKISKIWIRGTRWDATTLFYLDEFELSNSAVPRILKTTWNSPNFMDFEGGATPFSYSNVNGGTISAATANPNTTGINISTTCLSGDYPEGTSWNTQIHINTKADYIVEPASINHTYLHFLNYRNGLYGNSEIQIFDEEGNHFYQKQFSTLQANRWEEIVFDLTKSDNSLPGLTVGKKIGKIVIAPAPWDGTANQKHYYDSFVLSDSKDPISSFNYPTNLANFESGLTLAITATETQLAGATATIENNPLSSGVNTTAKVLKYYRPTAGADWWQSLRLYMNPFIGVQSPNQYLHFMMYNPAKSKITVVLENITGDAFEEDVYPVNNSAWSDYVINLDGLTNIRVINIRIPNDMTTQTVYFDEFVLSAERTPRQGEVIGGGTAVSITIDATTKYQTISGFGASDAWLAQPVGKLWKTETKEKISKWLFSNADDANGNPEGIGLSIWRFNLGAGSYEQGDASQIEAVNGTRAECFFDGTTYNWTKQAGQQYFLEKAAKTYNVPQLVLFANSPPVSMTANGLARKTATNHNYNLASSKYSEYANFMATVLDHFKTEGMEFSYISPINEPQWDWNETKQEGTPATNTQFKDVVTALNTALVSKSLTTKIMLSEAADWKFISDGTQLQNTDADNQLTDFFGGTDIKNLSNVPMEMAAHSYWSDLKNNNIKTTREAAYTKAKSLGVTLQQTEWSALSANDTNGAVDGIPSYENASKMDLALYLAKIMYADLKYAQVASWSYWTAFAYERYSQKNRFHLIRLRPNGDDYASAYEYDGYATSDKNMWALGNYSRFVKPGYQRVALTGLDKTNGAEMSELMGTAYLAPDNSKIVVVLNNLNQTANTVSIAAPFTGKKVKSATAYLTNANHDLANMGEVSVAAVNVPARSVQTIVIEYETDLGTDDAAQTLSAPICFVNQNMITIRNIEAGSRIQLFDTMGKLLYEITGSSNEITFPCMTKVGIVKVFQHGKTYTNKVITL